MRSSDAEWATNRIKYGNTTDSRNAQKLSSFPSAPVASPVVASSGLSAVLAVQCAMAFLGIFSKRDKHKNSDGATIHTSSAASDVDPSEPDYVLPSSSKVPSIYSGPPGASSSKLKLGFKAKRSPVPRNDNNYLSPPSSAFLSVRSESENNLLSPPPPRSAVFSGYNDPTSAHSTRSLPTQPTPHSRSNSKEYIDLGSSGSPLPLSSKQHKGGGLFSWAHRERKKSKPPPPPSSPSSTLPDISIDSDSFNLRSFRHVRPASPNDSPSASMPPVRPRPREGSFVSDSSQRISVAAFREAQARRSAANSPVPSFSHDAFSPGSATSLRPPSTSALRNSRSISGDSDGDESEVENSEASATLKPRRDWNAQEKRSPVVSSGRKSTSELGHKNVRANPNPPPPPPLRMAMSAATNASFAPQATAYARPRASASTSAIQPSTAARRASGLAAQQQQRSQPIPGKLGTHPASSWYHRYCSLFTTLHCVLGSVLAGVRVCFQTAIKERSFPLPSVIVIFIHVKLRVIRFR